MKINQKQFEKALKVAFLAGRLKENERNVTYVPTYIRNKRRASLKEQLQKLLKKEKVETETAEVNIRIETDGEKAVVKKPNNESFKVRFNNLFNKKLELDDDDDSLFIRNLFDEKVFGKIVTEI